MPSILPGYEYDIFISYRQKDNKYDGWVTEFVSNLQKELESTFKEDISVYFDVNPHTGLLETHDVDKSLEGKLKCLVFIPIISQTYCDTGGFAWKHEFCAFNQLAKADAFGRDIKVAGGNVTSRILPIKIHDLDAEDKSLLERELGTVLRPIEFIYKEPGVNRPLKDDDSELRNLNKTKYRNQINKTANAVKEIITAIKKGTSGNPETVVNPRAFLEAEPEQGLWEKLKNRNVIRFTTAYAVTSWVLLQIGQVVFSLFSAPDIFLRILFMVLLAGLPVVIILSWMFEFTGHGLKRWQKGTTTSDDKPARRKFRVADFIIIALLLSMVGYYYFTRGDHKSDIRKFKDGSIAIIPFENQTGRPELNSVGQVASDFISTQLIQNQFWKVIPTQDIFRQTVYSGAVTNSQAEKQVMDHRAVDYLVIGHYNLIEDEILLVAQVNDVAGNKILYTTPVIKCPTSNPMKAVNDAQQYILGFLMFSKNSADLTTRPPTYDAYLEYLKGMEYWTKSNLGPGNIYERAGSEIELHFKNAIALDTDFLPPYFKLAELFSIDRRYKQLDSVLSILQIKQNLFLEGDHLNFTIQKLILSKDWDGLERFLLTKTDESTGDFHPWLQLAVNSLYRQNRPAKALEYISRCDLSQFDFQNKPSDQTLYEIQAQALTRLKRYKEVESLTSGLTFKKSSEVLRYRWRALYFLNQKELADQEYNAFVEETKNGPLMAGLLQAGITLFRTAQLQKDSVHMLNYYRWFKAYNQNWDEKTLDRSLYKFMLAVMMFRTGEISGAEMLLKQNLPRVPRARRIHQLGLLYAATGRKEMAEEVIKELLSFEHKFDYGQPRYFAAKIEAALGHKEKSMSLLRDALAKGFERREDLFEFDSDLMTLADYPPFIQMNTPKE